MELIDSRRTQLDYAKILHVYHSNEVDKADKFGKFDTWMLATAAVINKLNPECAVIGNTFFMAKVGTGEDSHRAMVWAMNADTVHNMVDNITEGLTRLMNMGVTEIIAIYTSPVVSRVLRQAFGKITGVLG